MGFDWVDLVFFFFFFVPVVIGLIGGVWDFVPVGFWWLIWVDQRGGVWVLIGVDLGFFFFFSCCDRG